MKRKILKKVFNMFILTGLLIFLWNGNVFAQKADTHKPVSPEDIESVIQTLKEPAAREKLIQQLEVLIRAQAPPEKEQAIKGAAAQLLKGISDRVKTFSTAVIQITGGLSKLPDLVAWVKRQFADAGLRDIWKEVLTRIALVIGLGYLAFFLMRFIAGRLRRSLNGQEREDFMMRVLRLIGVLILDILPIAAFALATYTLLGFINPREKTRLIILAWVNAFIIVSFTGAVFRIFLAPDVSHLRLWAIKDETANYFDIWVHRFSRISVYGYFILQVMLFHGLPSATYETLLRMLGMVVTVLVIVLIFQNRQVVADFICCRKSEHPSPEGSRHLILKRIAQIWHLAASAYVMLIYGVWFFKIEGGFLFLLRATVITGMTLLLARTALGFVNTFFRHGFKVSEDLKDRFPSLEERSNLYLSSVMKGFRIIVWILMALAVTEAWGVDTIGWMTSESGMLMVRTIIKVLAIVVVTFVIWEVANSLIVRLLSDKDDQGESLTMSARGQTLHIVSRKTLIVVLIVVSAMMILSELGVDIGPLLAGAGVLGLAIGFGAQKFVQDVVTGVFILFENQISVGDIVKVADKGGVVEAVSIRSVRLRDYSGTVHIIPYSSISTVSNLTKDFSFYVFEVGIAYRENVDEVMEVLKQIGSELQEDSVFGPLIKEPLEISGLDSFGDSAVVIKARIKTIPTKQWATGREFNKRMKKKFDELGIEIPFPHRTIYMGQDKEGQSPPLKVDVKGNEA